MKCLILYDNTLSFPLNEICDLLNNSCKEIKFTAGNSRLRFQSKYISNPDSYNKLSDEVISECSKYDLSFLLTNVRYDNNFFFDFSENIAILSFHRWNKITDLPMTNGLIYFIASILCDQEGIGETHEDDKGCINDFWWDRNGVDVGMRAAFICPTCKDGYQGNKNILTDIETILDMVSQTSRKGNDILTLQDKIKMNNSTYDVFLCHNSTDKESVRKINKILKNKGIKTWLDEERIGLGDIWQDVLENEIKNIKNVCVFVGQSGQGPWQEFEIRAFLDEFAQRKCRIIPVILSDASSVPDLPLFLRQMMWLDLRKEFDKNIDRLVETLKKIV